MTNGAQKETLSALVDDEVTELELRRALRDLDEPGKASWQRWHLARDLMGGHAAAAVPAGFSADVVANLGAQSPCKPAWRHHMSRLAVAASVAAATVVGWQYMQHDPAPGAVPGMAASQETRVTGAMGTTALVAGGQVSAPERSAPDQGLDGMVMRHNDLSARHSGQGVTPYARFVSLQAKHASR